MAPSKIAERTYCLMLSGLICSVTGDSHPDLERQLSGKMRLLGQCQRNALTSEKDPSTFRKQWLLELAIA